MDFQLTTRQPASPAICRRGPGIQRAPTVPLRLAVLPLVVPIPCLGGSEIAAAFGFSWARTGDGCLRVKSPRRGLLELWSQPGFVLMVSAAIAYLLLRAGLPRGSRCHCSRALQDAA